MDFTKIKLPKIPTNIHNLRNYVDFLELIKFAQKINKDVDKYAKQIVYGEYLKSKSEWKNILSEKDFAKIKDFKYRYHASFMINEDPYVFYSIGDNIFYKVKPKNIAPTTGYGEDHFEFSFDIENQKIEVNFITSWSSSRPYNKQSERPPVVDIQTFIIDLNSKIISKIEEEIDEFFYLDFDDDELSDVEIENH